MCLLLYYTHSIGNDTNVTDITIPAVLLSQVRTANSRSTHVFFINIQTVGLSLLSYSSPTDAEPTGSVVVEAHYVDDYAKIMLIVIGCAGFLILAMIASLVSTHACMYICNSCM